MFKVVDRLHAIFSTRRVDHRDRTARRAVVFSERSHNQPRIRNRASIKNGFGKDHVVGEESRLLRTIWVNRPEGLDGERVLVDVFPTAKQNASVGQRAGVKFVDVVHRDRMHVRAIRVHDMRNRDARVVAGDQAAGPGCEKGYTSVRQISRGDIVLALLAAMIVSQTLRRVGQLSQAGSIDADFINTGIPRRLSFKAEEQRFGIPREIGVGVNALTERLRGSGIDNRTNHPFRPRRCRILQHIDSTAARWPFVIGVVDVNATVRMAFGEQQRCVKLL